MTIRTTQQASEILITSDAHPGAESCTTGNEPSSWTETTGDWDGLTSIGGDLEIASV